MSKFKVGPAKLRDGREARIYALDGQSGRTIHGAFIDSGGWLISGWLNDGSYLRTSPDERDLLPNAEPERYEVTCEWYRVRDQAGYAIVPVAKGAKPFFWEDLVGETTKLTIEVLNE